MHRRLIISFLLLCASMCAYAGIPRPEYPRPQFQRSDWVNLNGTWTYAFDFDKTGQDNGFAGSQGFGSEITVPFCPESKLSGVEYDDFINCMWYQRQVQVPSNWEGEKILLHFGAVDYSATLYVNGNYVGMHSGGSVSFEFDITRFVKPGETANLVLRVVDETLSGLQPIGKQSPKKESYECLYTRTTGIWQTVWMEAVNPYGLKSVYVKPDIDNSCFVFEPEYYKLSSGEKLRIKILDGARTVASKTTKVSNSQSVVIPVKKAKLWTTENPFLYDIVYEVLDAGGKVIDKVQSYAGMRKIHVEDNRLYLNNKPVYLRFVLDQGYYPDGVWTAPSDEDLKNDILLSQAAGFNGARLHQKVFEERFHYWADKLGYLTWGEFPSWGVNVFSEEASRNYLAEWEEVVLRDRNHPSIIAWVPFNETWYGPVHERLVKDIYNFTHTVDYRPINDASGGAHVLTDIWSIHNYDHQEDVLRNSLTIKEDGKLPTLYPDVECPYEGQPFFVDETGGITWIVEGSKYDSWGYGENITDLEKYKSIITAITSTIASFDYISGYCFTQLYDIEQEQNGIYTYDRQPKFDIEAVKPMFSLEPEWAK